MVQVRGDIGDHAGFGDRGLCGACTLDLWARLVGVAQAVPWRGITVVVGDGLLDPLAGRLGLLNLWDWQDRTCGPLNRRSRRFGLLKRRDRWVWVYGLLNGRDRW